MVSWLEELDRREAATRQEIAELRDNIGELTRRLAVREEVLSRLEITRETMTEILSGGEAVTEPGAGTEPEAGGPEEGPIRMGSPVGVRLVPLAGRAGLVDGGGAGTVRAAARGDGGHGCSGAGPHGEFAPLRRRGVGPSSLASIVPTDSTLEKRELDDWSVCGWRGG